MEKINIIVENKQHPFLTREETIASIAALAEVVKANSGFLGIVILKTSQMRKLNTYYLSFKGQFFVQVV
jgi:hypothetical protein